MPSDIIKIISGGQTGADRAALDFAITRGIAIGGFVPKGRLAEDGIIPARYDGLIESASSDPPDRTRLNVLNSDATLILSHGELIGGSKLTQKSAIKDEKPFLHIDLSRVELADATKQTAHWLVTIDCSILNVAGPRASEDGKIYDAVTAFLKALFSMLS